MSGEPPAPSGPRQPASVALRPGTPLRSLRCVRHTEREAVARCPVCGGSFCRECVSEHEGRLLCAPCLAREVSRAVVPAKRRDWGALRRVAATTASVLVLWGLFFLAGSLLVRIPPDFHEGKVWRSFEEANK